MTTDETPVADTIDYLSDEWLDEADRAVADLTPLPDPVLVGIRVVGERATRHYSLVLGPDRVAVRRPDGDDGDEGDTAGDTADESDEGSSRSTRSVRLTMPLTVAAAVAQGRVGAQRAFLDGQIQLGGDTTVLLGYQQQLSDIDDRLASLRARTRFPETD
jgi:hypothetical protein